MRREFERAKQAMTGGIPASAGSLSKGSDTVGQPQVVVFIGLKKGSGQEYLSREPLTEQQALALLHASAGRLFSIIYYINSFL